MKKYFITGLATLLPTTLTLIVIYYLFTLLTDPFVGLVTNLLSNYVTNPIAILIISKIGALLLLLISILLLGYLCKRLFFDPVIQWIERIFLKIPLVKTIYKISAEVTKAFFSQGTQSFKRPVLVPFPHDKSKAMGFVTSETAPNFVNKELNINCSVFVPTAPHPLSGFILLMEEKEITSLDISTEEAFKFILSCGMLPPKL